MWWFRWQRQLLCKPGDLSSSPRSHAKMERENQLRRAVLWAPKMPHDTHIHIHHARPHTQTHTPCMIQTHTMYHIHAWSHTHNAWSHTQTHIMQDHTYIPCMISHIHTPCMNTHTYKPCMITHTSTHRAWTHIHTIHAHTHHKWYTYTVIIIWLFKLCWRAASAVKSTCCSSRGLEFSSQNPQLAPHNDLHLQL